MKFKLYEYQWYDHFDIGGWRTSISSTPYIVHSVGFLIGEDKHHYHFTDGIVPTEIQYRGVMSIVKSALKSKKLIKTYEI